MGVLVDVARVDPKPHSVTLVSNTIAMNAVGVWNGQTEAWSLGVLSTGLSKLMLVNNIFDSKLVKHLNYEDANCTGTQAPPSWERWIILNGMTSISAFEGIDVDDLTTTGNVDLNAYAAGNGTNYNIIGNPASPPHTNISLPATRPRNSNSPASPGFDIGPLTGAGDGTKGRGVLYIRDLFYNGSPFHPLSGSNHTQSCNFDLSPGDFRLAPWVADAHLLVNSPNAPGAGGMPNPLVDVGTTTLPLTMKNGMSLNSGPGFLDLPTIGGGGGDPDIWNYDQWVNGATDGEGFGNPRIVDHPEYTGTGIDIGADEVDVMIFGGYRFGTTMFTRSVTGTNDNRYMWMFGPVGPVNGTLGVILPHTTIWTTPGIVHPGLLPWDFSPPRTYYNPTVVDICPHLLPDVHPHHALTTNPAWPTNPIWQDCSSYTGNWALYIDPWAPIVNPNGSLIAPFTAPGYNWLDVTLPAVFMGPISAGGPTHVTQFGSWCQNVGTTQDWHDMQQMMPILGLTAPQHAARLTFEFLNTPGAIPFNPPGGQCH